MKALDIKLVLEARHRAADGDPDKSDIHSFTTEHSIRLQADCKPIASTTVAKTNFILSAIYRLGQVSRFHHYSPSSSVGAQAMSRSFAGPSARAG